jgi:hypothetical protein
MATAGGASTRNQAHIIAVVGASGNGKGLYVKAWLRKTRGPILVWSPLEETDQYAGVIGGTVVTSIADLVAAIKAKKTRLVYVPNKTDMKAQFDRFCRVAWELTGWVIVVEELSQVTKPSWAPPAWSKLSTAGRHRGLTIIGTAQRPAMVDKAFFGNCSEIRCYAVGYIEDARVMAGTMFCDYKEILALPQYHYIHRDVRAKINAPGVVPVPKN